MPTSSTGRPSTRTRSRRAETLPPHRRARFPAHAVQMFVVYDIRIASVSHYHKDSPSGTDFLTTEGWISLREPLDDAISNPTLAAAFSARRPAPRSHSARQNANPNGQARDTRIALPLASIPVYVCCGILSISTPANSDLLLLSKLSKLPGTDPERKAGIESFSRSTLIYVRWNPSHARLPTRASLMRSSTEAPPVANRCATIEPLSTTNELCSHHRPPSAPPTADR
jgi:hypothetical protein